MGDMNFRDKLDSELKNIVFSDKSRNSVLERVAEHRKAASHENADINGRVASHNRMAIRDRAALYGGAADYGSADGNGRATSRSRAVLRSNPATSDRRASGAKAWRERFQFFMNMELRIPVKPLVVALLITVSGIVYACIGITRVSAEDIRNSSIAVVDSNQGGQTDGIYKN